MGSIDLGEKTYNSFCCIALNEEILNKLPQLENYFEKLSSVPHITLLDPFYSEDKFPTIVQQIQELNLSKFTIHIDSFDVFTTKKGGILFLNPDQNSQELLINIQSSLQKAFPDCTEVIRAGKFSPHITVSRFNTAKELKETLESESANFEPFEFLVKEINLLSRIGKEKYQIKNTIFLC